MLQQQVARFMASSATKLYQRHRLCVRQLHKPLFYRCHRSASSSASLELSGVYPPIATPFNRDESIAWDKLEHNLSLWNEVPFRGYVVQGSNGEYTFLTADERVEMVKRVRTAAPADKLIIAGSGCESTRETIRMTVAMAEVGADAVMVVTPCYFKASMNNDAMETHFKQVADASPVPVILYSVPANTGIDLAPEVIIKLSSHPNIIGVKESGGDISKIGNLVHKTKENGFQVLAGSAGFLLPAYVVGCVGGVCALANILGNEVCHLQTFYHQGQMSQAQALQHRLIAPNAGVTKRFGVPGLKVAMEHFGYYGGPTRSPLQPLSQSQKQDLLQTFSSHGFKPQ